MPEGGSRRPSASPRTAASPTPTTRSGSFPRGCRGRRAASASSTRSISRTSSRRAGVRCSPTTRSCSRSASSVARSTPSPSRSARPGSCARWAGMEVPTGKVLGLWRAAGSAARPRTPASSAGWSGRCPAPAASARLEIEPGFPVGDVADFPEQEIHAVTLDEAGAWTAEGTLPFGALDAGRLQRAGARAGDAAGVKSPLPLCHPGRHARDDLPRAPEKLMTRTRSAPAVPSPPEIQRPPAEVLYADELARLREADAGPRPPGWQLSLHGGAPVRPRRRGARRAPQVRRRPLARRPRHGHPGHQPRADAGRRAGHGQVAAVRAARRGHLGALDADHPGQRRHHRGPDQVLVELRPAGRRGADARARWCRRRSTWA